MNNNNLRLSHRLPLLLLLFFSSGMPFQASAQERSFEANGLTRSYFLHLPDNLPKDAPLVFTLHGYGGTAPGIMEFSGMNAVADQYGFAVCYPQANMGEDGKPSWNAGYSNPGVDDVSFLASLAQYLQKKYQLSSVNTFCTGMSNGADMSYVLACQKPAVFSAIAPVAGCMMQSTFAHCAGEPPVPVFEIHGTKDDITLWEGDANYSDKYGGYLGTVEIIDFWVEKNECNKLIIDTLTNTNLSDSSFVVSKKYTEGKANHEVWLYQLVGGKHDWPGSWGNMDFVASEEIWAFFSRFVR